MKPRAGSLKVSQPAGYRGGHTMLDRVEEFPCSPAAYAKEPLLSSRYAPRRQPVPGDAGVAAASAKAVHGAAGRGGENGRDADACAPNAQRARAVLAVGDARRARVAAGGARAPGGRGGPVHPEATQLVCMREKLRSRSSQAAMEWVGATLDCVCVSARSSHSAVDEQSSLGLSSSSAQAENLPVHASRH